MSGGISIKNNKVIFSGESRKAFIPNVFINAEDFKKCIDFADQMAYGLNHKVEAFGGEYVRSDGEIFKNALQGKLAEVAFYNFYTQKGKIMPMPEFSVWPKGTWEDCDVEVNGKKISIKSTKHFGNLLLLETRRYSSEGLYLEPTDNKNPIKYDLTYMIRVKGVESVIPESYKSVSHVQIEISGYLTHEDFLSLIHKKQILKKGVILGTPLIVDNYYIALNDLHRV